MRDRTGFFGPDWLEMDNIIYRSKSKLNNFSFYCWIIFCLAIIGYLSFHFTENPVIITIIASILLFIILGNSRDIIVVREAYFEIVLERLLPQLSTTKKFQFSEIENIEADLPLTKRTGVIADMVTVFGPFPRIVINTITINYKNGRKKKLSANIDRDSFHEGFRFIKKMARIDIVVNDIAFS